MQTTKLKHAEIDYTIIYLIFNLVAVGFILF